MVRLSDLPEYEREHLLAKNMPPLGPPVWVNNSKALAQLRVALITTAGPHFRESLGRVGRYLGALVQQGAIEIKDHQSHASDTCPRERHVTR